MRIAIIGAGMAGLACAEGLRVGSDEIVLFDKGDRPGGRLSTRITATSAGPASFDHGARSFHVRDAAFRVKVARWQGEGVVTQWPPGEGTWVGVPGMSAPLAAMAGAFVVRWRTRVDALTRRDGRWNLSGEDLSEQPFDRVVVAVPAEQVPPLVAAVDRMMAARAGATTSQPCWTLMVAFAARPSIHADVIEGAHEIGWAIRNSAKPGRSGPEAWVIQASADWSRTHLEDDATTIVAGLLDAFARLTRTRLPDPLLAQAHRWRYATSGASRDGFLWNDDLGLGVCGDWLIGPDVESAWLSGTALARRMGGSS